MIYKSKRCQAAEFSKSLFCLHRRWLSWCFADWSPWLREPLLLFNCNWVLRNPSSSHGDFVSNQRKIINILKYPIIKVRIQSEIKFHLQQCVQIVVSNPKNCLFFLGCRIQRENSPFKDLNLPNMQKFTQRKMQKMTTGCLL